MNVFSLVADSKNYGALALADRDRDWQDVSQIGGTPLRDRWRPLEVEFIPNEKGDYQFPPGDLMAFVGYLPVFSSRAISALKPVLEGNGELLPLACNVDSYAIFNVTRLIDGLDEGRSEIVRFSDGRILDIQRFEFWPDRLNGISIFKIPQMPFGRVFVTDSFVVAVEKAELTAFTLEPVWSTDSQSTVTRFG
jgi:hypothetical protein